MDENTTIHFDKIRGSWLWSVKKGKYQVQGVQDSLIEAEKHAFKAVNQLSESGTIHTIYNPPKYVSPAKGKMSS